MVEPSRPARADPGVRPAYVDAVERGRRWTAITLWATWWAVVTAALWFLGAVFDQRPDLVGCAASAVLVIVVGEVADRLRRRFYPRRRTR